MTTWVKIQVNALLCSRKPFSFKAPTRLVAHLLQPVWQPIRRARVLRSVLSQYVVIQVELHCEDIILGLLTQLAGDKMRWLLVWFPCVNYIFDSGNDCRGDVTQSSVCPRVQMCLQLRETLRVQLMDANHMLNWSDMMVLGRMEGGRFEYKVSYLHLIFVLMWECYGLCGVWGEKKKDRVHDIFTSFVCIRF